MKNKKIEEIINSIDDSAQLVGECKIGLGTKILGFCVLENAIIGDNCQIGPMCHIHGGSEIGDNCRIGNFVEINRSKIENNVKIAHLSYVGDAHIGEFSNVGAGVVFCNYDGKNKHKTEVGKKCFIGSNCSVIAPRNIGDNCAIGASSVVDCDLPDNTFFVARPTKKIKPNNILK